MFFFSGLFSHDHGFFTGVRVIQISNKFHPHPVIFVEDNLSHDGIDAEISHSIRLFLLAYRLVIPNHGVMRHCFSLFFDKHILSN